MNNEWITDRLPTAKDCLGADRMPDSNQVWVMYEGQLADFIVGYVVACPYEDVVLGCPWQPIIVQKPEPYVKPKVWTAVWEERDGLWTLHNTMYNQDELGIVWLQYLSDKDAHREAAERIAAIYEEVMP